MAAPKAALTEEPDPRGLLARAASLVFDPMLSVLLVAIAIAVFLPATGTPRQLVGDLSTAAIVLLFFLHGVRLSREAVVAGLTHWRLHLTILACTYALFPLLALSGAAALPGLLEPGLWLGILFLAVLPSTVQSSIAFTSIAGGNVPGAVCSAAASNLLGVALTPALIALLAEARGGNAFSLASVGLIVVQILLPFVVGHLARPWLGAWAAGRRRLLSFVDRGTIVLAVYVAFSDATVEGLWRRLPATELLTLVTVCAVFLGLILLLTGAIARLLGFAREDRVAILFCGSKKSLATGVPMARVLFPGSELGLIVLPLIIFHQLQLVACAVIARRLARTTATAGARAGR
jgi:sodium/bile acid cotransporter 7